MSHRSEHPRLNGGVFVLECECKPKTNSLGRVQRLIVDYLATAPAGFDGMLAWSASGETIEHGHPCGVSIRAIATAVYAADEPSPAQTRAVQRAVRRLEHLGIADCRHGLAGIRERAYVTRNGFTADQPVSALFVALRWECGHLDEKARRDAERKRAEEERQARRDAAFDSLADSDPIAALQTALHLC